MTDSDRSDIEDMDGVESVEVDEENDTTHVTLADTNKAEMALEDIAWHGDFEKGVRKARKHLNAVPVEDVEALVQEWREKGSDKRLAPDGLMETVGEGKGMEQCADELEQLLQDHHE